MEVREGYKNTEVGVIPEDWEIRSLEYLCIPAGLVRGPFGGALKKEYFVKSGYKVYEQRNAIYKNSSIGNYYINKNKFDELIRFAVKQDDFIISCSGTIGKIFKIPKNHEQGIINQALLKLSLDSSKVVNKFFEIYFSWDRFQYKIIDSTQGGAMKNLVGMDIFKKTLISIPPLPEQQAIAEALSDVDDLISSLTKLINKKKNIKQGAMQELLTGKKRLEGFSGDWEKKNLGFIVDFLKGSGLSKAKLSIKGKYKCLLYGELFTTYGEVIDSVISSTNYKEGTVSNKGDILMPGSTTTIGIDLAIASSLNIEDVLIGGDINILRPKVELNSEFLARYLSNVKKFQISQATQGITIIHLYAKDLSEMLIELPCLSEQTAIANILSDMDAEIEVLEQKLNKYKTIKQGMMQELLTGKIRLI